MDIDCCCVFTAITAIVFLYFLRRYIRGGVCRIERDLTGKVIILTGANSGIGF